MLTTEFYLLTDPSIICSYLVSKWIDNFANSPNFGGFLVKEEQPAAEIISERSRFHAERAGKKDLTDEDYQKLMRLYPDMEETDKAMISLFGVPKCSPTEYEKTFFLGNNVNRKYAKKFVREKCGSAPPYIFVSLTQILKRWWMEITNGQLISVHPAVLPYARGMYPVENIAALRDISEFKKSAGFTIHYVTEGVDLGSIIKAERIVDPFRFNSIWELKGYIYVTEFDAYIKTVKEIISNDKTVPAGIFHDPSLRGINYRVKDFPPDKRKEAEEGYLAMKGKAMLS